MTHANSAAPAIVLAATFIISRPIALSMGTSEPETLEEKLSLTDGKPASAAGRALMPQRAVVLESI